ncbi:C1 family peptidase [Azospirillum doebereinerae]|uniref:C1 family peptidase n=1 Tax=Azospirillum doebereinerae TaxID=92933 RepID=UPI001EE630C4|nr:C1 family peptidase [Azospirillum doebereinerae]MCG5239878.1 C1 family peptidase [Azospirillum doebereinerae]
MIGQPIPPNAPPNLVLNCIPSRDTRADWSWQAALDSGAIPAISSLHLPDSVDLRDDRWPVSTQGSSGACVGFATADGVLRYHFAKKAAIDIAVRLSPRFIWMADKETDELTSYPTTFIEQEGAQPKRALEIARQYGCALDDDLPMEGPLWQGTAEAFYAKAATFRIASFHNLGVNPTVWRKWLATNGPILTRLNVDPGWLALGPDGELERHDPGAVLGGHAVCVVGYRRDGGFIVRNSWGPGWGDQGFAYPSADYVKAAFNEGYGVVV